VEELSAAPVTAPLLAERPGTLTLARSAMRSVSATADQPTGAEAMTPTAQRAVTGQDIAAGTAIATAQPTAAGPAIATAQRTAAGPAVATAQRTAAGPAITQRTAARGVATPRSATGLPHTGYGAPFSASEPPADPHRTVVDAAAVAASDLISSGIGHFDVTGALVLDPGGVPAVQRATSIPQAVAPSALRRVPPRAVQRSPLTPPLPHPALAQNGWADAGAEQEAIPVVQTLSAEGPGPVVQTDADPAAPAPPVQEPAAATAPAAAAAAGPGAGPLAGLALDELVRQLFDPLCSRLKAELRLDRERAGLLTDLHR
jgi:hypothetical protein